ncbi:DUF3060 domain-containing protein [Sphingobacterium suaedae]|uniref:DUF3060 domain-containing protein n=1 Tax=Sphingobacterium suaedae TaxID=1686402 RepID=A0ABW5KB67_9SPHI
MKAPCIKLLSVFVAICGYCCIEDTYGAGGKSNKIDPPKNDLIIIYQHGKVVKVEGMNNEKKLITNGDETLQIAGSHNVIYAIGGLKSISISGINNEIYVDRIHNVKIEGTNNLVHYKLANGKAGKPVINLKGERNDVIKVR